MNYQEALEKLEMLRVGYKKLVEKSSYPVDELCMLYGELEEVIDRFAGIGEVKVPIRSGVTKTYPNYIAARLLSGDTLYTYDGYTQVLKVIGKVRQHAEDPTVPQVEYSVTNLIQVLLRFRECCQYLTSPLQNEKDVQGMLWIMLRSHFARLNREETLLRFAAKAYRPDFGIPDLRVLVEVKFIGDKTDVAGIQEGILGDVPGYLNNTTSYDSIVVFVYDSAHKLRDTRKFVEDLKSVAGIVDVIVVPGVG